MKKNIIKILIILGLLLFIVFDIMYLIGCYVSLKFQIEDNVSSTIIDVIYNFVDKVAFFSIINALIISLLGGYILFRNKRNIIEEKKKSIPIFVCIYIILQLSVIFYSYYGLKSNSQQDMIGTNVMESINDMTIGLFTSLFFSLVICCLMLLFIHKRPITNDK
ncbi:hypothetical protein [Capnocytophaga sp. G2]|uniref:hypothetical protein n=1 Tax=Capnocytophaga sp. G2 TaxID=3110695 RepID=UPI002B498F25|nr:hypothetical protein [Capnocytophaga sp. G2]MEB3004236.1 hypothetical protein [Capnocytophaga sp. G2]